MQANQSCIALSREIQEWDPKSDVVAITADTIEALEKQGRPLSKINEWIGEVDHLLFSPSLGTGFSIDVEDHFDRIVAFAWQNVGTAQDLSQMLHRVRNPKSSEIYIWIRKYGSVPNYGVEDIEKQWKESVRQAVAQGVASGIDVTGVPVDPETGAPRDPLLWDTAVRVESNRRQWGGKGGLQWAFQALAEREGVGSC